MEHRVPDESKTHSSRSLIMADIYNGPGAEDASLDVIESLAEETHRPVPEVKPVYEAELRYLKSQARITDYVVLFAVRRAREALLRGRV